MIVRIVLALALMSTIAISAAAQSPVTATITVTTKAKAPADLSNVVVWLTPAREDGTPPPPAQRVRIVQQNRRFDPHLVVVPVGSTVEFPNRDPLFHNVFSLYDGKRFDLGLYEAGASKGVVFAKPGVSFIFCNIHPEMSAVVIAVDTPYYSVSDRSGRMTIPAVPAGRFRLYAWHERYVPAHAGEYPREVSVPANGASLGAIELIDPGNVITPHTNKYGQEYNPPHTSSPVYKKPGQ